MTEMNQRVQRIREAEARHAERDKEGAPLVLLDRAVRDCIDGKVLHNEVDMACLNYLEHRGLRGHRDDARRSGSLFQMALG